MKFSLMFFASTRADDESDRYRLLIDLATRADRSAMTAIWTPERHYHAFGGIYPNPAITSAALAMITSRISLRAGSVVLPLHDPIRVVEDWSMIDNLSGGRVGVSFASGWHPNDFAGSSSDYQLRNQLLVDGVERVRELWRTGRFSAVDGRGSRVQLDVLPRPVQSELPLWITSGGSASTFELAGRIGANVLTHLLRLDLDELGELIEGYRRARSEAGHDPESGVVTLMLHTFVTGPSQRRADGVFDALLSYMDSALDLQRRASRSSAATVVLDDERPSVSAARRKLLERSTERMIADRSLIGDRATCEAVIHRASAVGVDEIACLPDFGLGDHDVLDSFDRLVELSATVGTPEPAWVAHG